jgi:hypothetical protein
MCWGEKTPTPSASDAGVNPPAGVAPCPDPCTTKVFPDREVSQAVTEVISNAPAPYTGWNNTYSWTAKFTLAASRSPCSVKVTVKIKVTGAITAAQKAAWKSAIESKWNGKAKLVCPDPACTAACPSGYPVSVEVQYVDAGEHYTVAANSAAATATKSVTPDMGTWGVNDTVDVTHEFGHMLGAPEEYFTTNGTDFTAGGTQPGFRAPGAGVMNNPAGDPLPRNYDLIRQEAASAMGVSCTAQTP